MPAAKAVTGFRWAAWIAVCLAACPAQELPEAARRVFSRAIIPAAKTETPVAPAPAPAVAPAAAPGATPAIPPGPEIASPGRPAVDAKTLQASRAVAQTAWRYFEKNYQPATGWFDSVRGYPNTTMWDLASGIAAVMCAEKLDVITAKRAGELLSPALQTLAKLRLYNSELPNREYSTSTAAISGGPKATAGKGTGWSALDVGRLLIWLKIVSVWRPEYAGQIREIVSHWKFDRLAQDGEMFGIYFSGVREASRQEGRLGYEQYSASGYELWGVPLKRAKDYLETKPVKVMGTDLAVDTRNLPYLTSEPFLMAAFEVGAIDPTYTALTKNLFTAQQRRWETTGQATAASEDSLDRAPWFAYFNVFYQGQPWQCRDHSGAPLANVCGFSAKAALGWAALFDGDYSRLLEENCLPLATPDGYFAGRYSDGKPNASLNINTNAVILEAMLYRQRGRRPFLETTNGPK